MYVRAEVLFVSNRILAIPLNGKLNNCAAGANVVPSPTLPNTAFELDSAVAVHAGPVLCAKICVRVNETLSTSPENTKKNVYVEFDGSGVSNNNKFNPDEAAAPPPPVDPRQIRAEAEPVTAIPKDAI